jgi:hypothetical protein
MNWLQQTAHIYNMLYSRRCMMNALSTAAQRVNGLINHLLVLAHAFEYMYVHRKCAWEIFSSPYSSWKTIQSFQNSSSIVSAKIYANKYRDYYCASVRLYLLMGLLMNNNWYLTISNHLHYGNSRVVSYQVMPSCRSNAKPIFPLSNPESMLVHSMLCELFFLFR